LIQSFSQPTYLDFFIKILNAESFEMTVYGENVEMFNYIDDKVETIADKVVFSKRYNFVIKFRLNILIYPLSNQTLLMKTSVNTIPCISISITPIANT